MTLWTPRFPQSEKHIDKLPSRQTETAANERVNKQMYLCIGCTKIQMSKHNIIGEQRIPICPVYFYGTQFVANQ